MPSQFWSISSPAISVALGLIDELESLQSPEMDASCVSSQSVSLLEVSVEMPYPSESLSV